MCEICMNQLIGMSSYELGTNQIKLRLAIDYIVCIEDEWQPQHFRVSIFFLITESVILQLLENSCCSKVTSSDIVIVFFKLCQELLYIDLLFQFQISVRVKFNTFLKEINFA